MQITPIKYAPFFTSNARLYENEHNERIGTVSFMFRKDLDWNKFTKYAVQHFKNKENVNLVQFASSDGSEAYTQIITLLENHPKSASKFLPIMACDIDEEVVKAAQSGKLNLSDIDIENMGKDVFSKYFKKSKNNMYIKNDTMPYRSYGNSSIIALSTYDVSPILKNNVHFKKQDMYFKLYQLKDNSNTIILCRNVLGYMHRDEINFFTDLLSQKLKKDSLFVTGNLDVDDTNLEGYLMRKGFIRVMDNVYQKI